MKEELGSGFRNTTHYTKLYTNGLEAEFEEGDVFKMSVPLKVIEESAVNTVDMNIDGAIDGATIATKKNLGKLLKIIVESEGKRAPDYRNLSNLGSERTIERYINQLREVGFIEFKGTAAQTGGYYITDKLKTMLKE